MNQIKKYDFVYEFLNSIIKLNIHFSNFLYNIIAAKHFKQNITKYYEMKKFKIIILFVFFCCIMRTHSLFGKKNKNNCSIINYNDGSNFFKANSSEKKTSIFISNDMTKKLKDLNNHAKKCKIFIDVIRSFVLETHEKKTNVLKNPLYVGRGIEYELFYKNKTLLCDRKCLKGNYLFLKYTVYICVSQIIIAITTKLIAKGNKTTEVECFFSGLESLKWEKHSLANIVFDKEYDKSKYNDLKTSKQAEFISSECDDVYKLKYGEMSKVILDFL